MDEQEIQRRVQLAQACRHQRLHYLDENGNRLCFCCDAQVRPIDGVKLIESFDGAPC